MTSEREIEDIYPLSPMQQGMLFHSLYAPDSGVFIQQLICTVESEIDVAAFEQAWQAAINRHPILRTAFMWADLDAPLQIVCQSAGLPFEHHDWRGLSIAERHDQLDHYLWVDRVRGFDLSEAPLMRLALIQMAEHTAQFIWTYHHALLDGWSIPLVLKEIFADYAAFARGRKVSLAAPRPYRDYIAWLQSQDLATAEAFWRQVLAGFTAPTSLAVVPPEQRRPGPTGYATWKLQIAETTTGALQSLARRQGLTLNTLVQGVWALLLSHYSREDDVVFGATSAGRPPELVGVEMMVGLFINTLPVRVRVTSETALLTWLKQLQNQQMAMRQYEYSPLTQIQGWSDVPRGLPLFESIVVFENYPIDVTFQQWSSTSSIAIRNVRIVEQTHYPLTLMAVPGTALLLQITYDQGRFEPFMIERQAGHLQAVLEGIVANPDGRLDDLSPLTDAERRQMLVDLNATQSDYPAETCLHELFGTQVERTPDTVAVSDEDGQLTYQELNRRANQLAHSLQALGVGPDVPVGVYLKRSNATLVVLLGILKAGGVYVPLDLTYPSAHVVYLLEDTQVPLLLTYRRLTAKLPPHRAVVVCMDADWERIARRPESAPITCVSPANLSHIVYTSGSTGQPKGIAVAQHQLLNRLVWMWRAYPFMTDEVACQRTPLNFSVSLWELLGPLLQGVRTVILPDAVVQDAQQLSLALARHAVTRIVLVPSLLQMLLEPAVDLRQLLRRLRLWSVCGERLRLELYQRFRERLPDAILLHQYGASEVNDATCYDTRQFLDDSSCVPIGRPIANTQIYLLDKQMRPVPAGVPGEVYIGGVGLARGYLNRPDLTAERFIPNPFLKDEGGRMKDEMPSFRLYRMGDLACYRPDGQLEYIGRVDHQVKIRGVRVELGGIETILGKHPAVRQALVIAREDTPSEKRLVAYIIRSTEDRELKIEDSSSDASDPLSSILNPLSSELRAFLTARLPAALVPSAFVVLDQLPLTPNGKVDPRALPVPEQAGIEPEDAYVAPRTAAEELLAGIWADVLGVEQVSIYDNFFALGGHSLLATQVTSRIRAAFEVEPPLRLLFEAPTVAELAQVIASLQFEQGDDANLEMVQMVEQLSDDEIEAELRRVADQIRIGMSG